MLYGVNVREITIYFYFTPSITNIKVNVKVSPANRADKNRYAIVIGLSFLAEIIVFTKQNQKINIASPAKIAFITIIYSYRVLLFIQY